jgi:hypothetical protein
VCIFMRGLSTRLASGHLSTGPTHLVPASAPDHQCCLCPHRSSQTSDFLNSDQSLIETHPREAQKEVQNIALDSNFAIPGDPGFPLNQVCRASLLAFSAHITTSISHPDPDSLPHQFHPISKLTLHSPLTHLSLFPASNTNLLACATDVQPPQFPSRSRDPATIPKPIATGIGC